MLEPHKENLNLNKIIAEKKEIILVEGDMIVPDSKPDILNTICTSGVVSIYKKEVLEGKIRIDGSINTYIMYMPDGTEDTTRGINTVLDFSENISVSNAKEDMETTTEIKIKTIEAKVINGRKISIKATLEVGIKVYQNEEITIISELENENQIQTLKEQLKINTLVGQGESKIYAKENIQIENVDSLAEILRTNIEIVNKDIKVSYNKVLTKAEIEVTIMYLTEDNRINNICYKIPAVGFIDIQNVSEENICDVMYEIKNIIIKPNSQEEHSIYVEIELGVGCYAYEEKQISLIQDMYSPTQKINFETKNIAVMTEKRNINDIKQIREKINLKDIDGDRLVNTEVIPTIINENKINSKILYEVELNLKFIMENSKKQIIIKETKIPFDYVIDNLQNGENLKTENCMEIKSKDFIMQDSGNIDCNIDIQSNTSMYRNANINTIDSIQEDGEREEQDYSIIIYIVQKGDTLWKIAKEFGSTIDGIARVNGIENRDLIIPGQKLYIPKYNRISEGRYE